MKAKRIRSTNAHVVTCDDGTQILFSYTTPVAVYLPELGYYRTSQRYSVTTSRHVNAWASYVGTMTEGELTKVAFEKLHELTYLAMIQGRFWTQRPTMYGY